MDMVILAGCPDFKLLNGSRLIKNETAIAVVGAADLLSRARKYHSSIEETCSSVYEEARKKGFEQGLREASIQMSEQLAKAVAARQVTLQDLSSMLANIVTDTVKLILKDADIEQVYDSAIDAVSRLVKKSQWVELRVHPEHLSYARTAVKKLTAETASFPVITVIPDAALKEYDCIFQTDVGIADASLDVQLESIRAVIEASVVSIDHHLQAQTLQTESQNIEDQSQEVTESWQL
jgi:type III secretion protein L